MVRPSQWASRLTIRTHVLVAAWFALTIFSVLFSYLLYDTQKNEYQLGVDRKLMTGAVMARALVGANFHDRIDDGESVTTAEYLDIVKTYNAICLESGFQYLWSNLFLKDGTVVFTTGTSTSKTVENEDYALFFDVHSDPAAFDPVKANMAATFSTFHNEWGSGRMVLVPYEDARGRTYVFGASVSTQEFEQHLAATVLHGGVIFVGMLAFSAVAGLGMAQAFSRPLRRLDEVARDIAEGNYGRQANGIGGSAEIGSLARTINDMSEHIREKYGQLGKTVRELEETRDQLRRSRDDLEIRVEERTRDLRKLTQAVEQSAHMVIITDLSGTIEYVNRRFSELTGYAPEEAIGQNPSMLQSGDHTPDFYETLWSEVERNGTWSGEIKDRRKDGRVFWASMVMSRITDEYGRPTHYVAIHDDITERKLAEINLREAKVQAETASRAKSEMLANMSHELRTPLNAILGFSDSMMNQTFGPILQDQYKDYIRDIHHSGQHLLELINDVLDVSAVEAGKLELREEWATIDQVLTPCLRLVRPRAESGGVKMITDIPDHLPAVFVDVRRLTQAVLNLLSNAIKFTPENGTVTTAVFHRTGEGLSITVRDTGIGMTDAEAAKALEKFGQVDSGLARRFEGTGLGLTLVQGLTELHGGTFHLESRKDQGTRATITLPPHRIANEPPSRGAPDPSRP